MKTIRVKTEQVSPGMKVAEDIYTFNNQLIIPADTIISDKIITRLKFYSIQEVKIVVDSDSPDELPYVPIKEQSYLQKKKNSSEFRLFVKDLSTAVTSFQRQIKDVSSQTPTLNTNALTSDIKNLLSKCRTGIQVFDLLHCMRNNDDQTYIHSINVALVCTVMGSWLQLPQEESEILMLCGLLHDIGKLTIPSEILLKSDPLTPEEYNVIKTHAMRGYNYLRPKNIDTRIKLAAMTHHERCDGSGYPLNLRGDQIDDFAKIVAIADVYDAMTSARVYRGPLCPFEVIHVFESEGLTKFDPKFVMVFLDHITKSYVGNRVKLSNGVEGDIILMNRTSLTRPVIKCGETYIDLSKEPDLYVEKIV